MIKELESKGPPNLQGPQPGERDRNDEPESNEDTQGQLEEMHSRPGWKWLAPKNIPDPELGEVSFVGKTVVICLGNRYMRDDGIGIRVAEELRSRNLGEDILVYTHRTADLSLLWLYKGASRAIFVHALKSGEVPGTISRYTMASSKHPLHRLPELHSLKLADIFDIASQTGFLTCPVTIFGVEPKDCSVGEGVSSELASVVPRVVDALVRELESL